MVKPGLSPSSAWPVGHALPAKPRWTVTPGPRFPWDQPDTRHGQPRSVSPCSPLPAASPPLSAPSSTREQSDSPEPPFPPFRCRGPPRPEARRFRFSASSPLSAPRAPFFLPRCISHPGASPSETLLYWLGNPEASPASGSCPWGLVSVLGGSDGLEHSTAIASVLSFLLSCMFTHQPAYMGLRDSRVLIRVTRPWDAAPV